MNKFLIRSQASVTILLII